MNSLILKIESLYEKHERRISSGALLFGFIFDTLTLQRIDLLYENMVMLSYLLMAGAGIAVVNYLREHPPTNWLLLRVENYFPLFIQFAFGGLFSAFFIFYSRSSSFTASWPFLAALIFLLVGNEFFKKRYQELVFQVSVYFMAVLSFSIFFVPIITKTIGALTFILSGAVSLVFMWLFVLAILKISPQRYSQSKRRLRIAVLSIFASVNFLYFANLIPPIPLSMKDAGVYHLVERVEGGYRLVGEREAWYEPLLFFMPETMRWRSGDPLYAWSAIFAPTDLKTQVVHDWQYYDEVLDKWVSTSRISFPISGGRDGGYRGFSIKNNVFEGKWRVEVETSGGQVIGRIRFNVERSASAPELIEEIL